MRRSWSTLYKKLLAYMYLKVLWCVNFLWSPYANTFHLSIQYSYIQMLLHTYIKLILSLWFFFKLAIDYEIVLGENYCDKCIKKSSYICKNIINVLRYLVTFVKCIEKSSLRWLVTYVTILFPKLFQYRTTFQIIKDLERALHS